MKLIPSCATVAEILERAEKHPQLGARFINRSGTETFYSYATVVERARAAAAALKEAGLQKGDRVGILLPTSIEFFDAFLGTQLAGGIPAALYPPFRLGKLQEYLVKLSSMLTNIGTRFLVTNTPIRSIVGGGVESVSSIDAVLSAGGLTRDLGAGKRIEVVDADPESTAFLQFSSGTTLEPKAVMVTHKNLVTNLEMMRTVIGPQTDEEAANGAVCWLPLYHDMGLVGNLYMGLYFPGTVTYIGPDLFIAKPQIWLQTISRYRAAISAAPNFAYSYCLSRITDKDLEGVDLSSWRMALNGAEPVEISTMRAFEDKLRPYGLPANALTPVYGLSEAGLAVSFPPLDQPMTVSEFDRDALSNEGEAVRGSGRKIVSVGQAMPGLEIEIHDDVNQRLPDGCIGRIVVRGPSITPGYYENPELTAKTIHDGWLDTGDLGFLDDGNLYISGRLKDLIVMRGRNYAPQEIEELIQGVDGILIRSSVAVSCVVDDGGERLFVLSERDPLGKRDEDDIKADIKNAITTGLSITPHHIELIEHGTLPRTSSGKLQRSKALSEFLNGELTPPSKVNAFKLLKDVGKSQLSWARFRKRRRS